MIKNTISNIKNVNDLSKTSLRTNKFKNFKANHYKNYFYSPK